MVSIIYGDQSVFFYVGKEDFMELSDPITRIKGIGEKKAKDFEKIEIYTILELLEHYPERYENYEEAKSISDLTEGELVAIHGWIVSVTEVKKVKNLQIISCKVQDSSGSIWLSWFNQPYLKNILRKGYRFIFRGKVVNKNTSLIMQQPKIYKEEEYEALLYILQPIYTLTDGLTNHAISKAVKQVLDVVDLFDFLPKRVQTEYSLIARKDAVSEIHFPKSLKTALEARRRLVFDEFFLFSLALRQLKETKLVQKNNFVMQRQPDIDRLIESLPYELTNAQKKVWEEIYSDMTKEGMMNRLVQGDVGSGKTILAILALFLTALNGCQGCLMVPTEVLAKQHYEEIYRLLSSYGIECCLLTGSTTAAVKRRLYQQIEDHEVDIIIGTHALIQEKAIYDRLALVITDEQHRFGVRQRERLERKGNHPHVLVMSATPIPRTLAIILYGDLDISILNELPANRLPIKNCVVDTKYRQTAYQFIEQQVKQGHQAYVICPMVEESEIMEAENVIAYTQQLKEILSEQIRVEYLHGKMKAREKESIMERFAGGLIQVLVSTTVVEVGINVPNATVMMIENAERFGLAQLHQLRGRVGRGKYQSYCILVSSSTKEETLERLEILNKSNDGFYIAEEDLKLRGPGDVFGIRQSGEIVFKLGDIYQDAKTLKEANQAADTLTDEEYQSVLENYPALQDRMIQLGSGKL